MQKRCANCNAPMDCHPEGGCWCDELPRVPMPSDPSAGCLCRTCLEEKIKSLGAQTATSQTPLQSIAPLPDANPNS